MQWVPGVESRFRPESPPEMTSLPALFDAQTTFGRSIRGIIPRCDQPLESPNAPDHVRQAPQRRHRPMPTPLLLGGRAEHPRPVGNIVMKARTSGDEGTFADSQVARGSHTRHDDRAPPDDRTSREAGLGNDQGILTDVAVVRDLDLIVDLGTAPNSRFVEGRPIDGRIRADLDVVFEHNAAPLSHGNRSPFRIRDVTKSVSTEHDAGL